METLPEAGRDAWTTRSATSATIPKRPSGAGLPSHHRGDAVGTEASSIHLGIHSGPPERSCRTSGETWGVRVVPANHWQGEGPWPPRESNTGTGCGQSDRNALCAGLGRRVSEKVVRSTQRDAPQSSSPPAVKPIWRPRSRDPSPSRSAHRIAPEPRKPPGATAGPEPLWSRPGWCTRWRLIPSISAISVSPRRQDFLARWTSHRGSRR